MNIDVQFQQFRKFKNDNPDVSFIIHHINLKKVAFHFL